MNKKIIFIIGGFVLVAVLAYVIFPKEKKNEEVPQQEVTEEEQVNMFTVEQVATHSSDDDCWVLVDGQVFNVTEAAKWHPGMFKCGNDVSENYHKNHGSVVRPQMLVFKIGEVKGGGIEHVSEDVAVKDERQALQPQTTFLTERRGWNTLDLMAVVERDSESLLFIDSSAHEAVARITGVGYQPHTEVFSPDAKFSYLISRDGWVTKINLETLRAEKSVRVGLNSRGTALTDDGKFLVIGNYEPETIVVLNPETLEVIKTIDLVVVRDGKTLRSRAGALVESGQQVIIALKDLNSVWVLDTSKEDLPISNMYWNIGGMESVLHDGYLTADGKYFVVAAQDANVVWVLDVKTMKEIARVPTGKKPHTGPGATWGHTTFVPSLGEGILTAIDTRTWTAEKYIKTGGPGLFVRSYDDPAYPYVWADAAFGGEHNDEIYVIDGKTLEIVKTLIPMDGKQVIHPEFTRDGKYVYVIVWGGNKVYVYDSLTFEVKATIDATTPSVISNVGVRLREPGL